MSFEQKTWEDRKSEYPNRRMLTKENGSTELVTVARAEGTISAEGDAYSAENMNYLEKGIKQGFEDPDSNIKYDQETDMVLLKNDAGEWVEWKAGEQSQLDVHKSFPTTGDWTISSDAGSSEVSVNGTTITFTSKGDAANETRNHYHWSSGPIDLSKFSKLILNLTYPRGFAVGLCRTIGATTPDILFCSASLDKTGTVVDEYDVSTCEGEYYIFVKTMTWEHSGTTKQWVFNEFTFTN